MEEFTPFDWIIMSIMFTIGLGGAIVKVFMFDDPEIRENKKRLKK